MQLLRRLGVRGVEYAKRELALLHKTVYPHGERSGWALTDIFLGFAIVGAIARFAMAMIVTAGLNSSSSSAGHWVWAVVGILWGAGGLLTPGAISWVVRENGKTGQGTDWKIKILAVTDMAWALAGLAYTRTAPFYFGSVLLFLLVEYAPFLSWGAMLTMSFLTGMCIVAVFGGSIQVLWIVAIGLLLVFLSSRLRILSLRTEQMKKRSVAERVEPYLLLEQLGGLVVEKRADEYAYYGSINGIDGKEMMDIVHGASSSFGKCLQSSEYEDGVWRGVIRVTIRGSLRWIEWTVRSRMRQDEPNEWQWVRGRENVSRERLEVIVFFDRTAAESVRVQEGTESDSKEVAPLAHALAHEIRNPLAALISSSEQMGEDGLEEQDLRTLAELVNGQAGRLRRLVDDFLELSRVERRQVRNNRMEDVLRTALGHVDMTGASVDLDIEPAGGIFDADLVERALVNIVGNAVQIAGGKISVRGRRDKDWYRIHVRDWGPGIAISDRPTLFQPFVTRRKGGTGLGLAIVERSAHALGGLVECVTPEGAREMGDGVEFVLALPLNGAVEVGGGNV